MASSPSTSSKKKGGLGVRVTNLKAGWDKNFTGKATLTAGPITYTVGSMDTRLDAMIQPYTALTTVENALVAARKVVKEAEPANLAEVDAITLALQGFYGKNNPVLLDFGIALPKPRAKPSAVATVASKAKAKETRKLRGTLGSKEKASIKSTSAFTVTTAVVAPVTTGSTGADPAAPVTAPVAPANAAPAAAPGAAAGK